MRENEDLESALVSYIALIKRGDYYDAHEVLEEAWHPLRKRSDPLHTLVKGLINAAIAFEHLKRGDVERAKRARRVMSSYERYKDLSVKGIPYYELFTQACQEVEKLKATHRDVFIVCMPSV